MSNERNESGIDPLVSDAYRDLASEQTPDSLNQAVMRMAARESRTRYSIARTWLRPAAWAATIGLSLAVVLQLSELPEPAGTSEPAYAPEPASASEPASAPVESEPVKESLLREAAPDEPADEQTPPAAKTSRPQLQQPAEKVTATNEAAMTSADSMQDTPAAGTVPPGDDSAKQEDVSAEAVAPRNGEVLERAEDLAGIQSGFEQEAARQTTSAPPGRAADFAATETFSMGTAGKQAADAHLCPAEARTSAEKWFQCINALRETAPGELIDREFEILRESFPEFEHAAPDR